MIQLPDKFNKKINESSNWSSNVNRIINNVSEYFMRAPFFFPEYTIHGEMHVNNVLAISNELISDKCMDFLTSRDIALLVISLITHDIGMFLERDGVHSLLFGDYASKKTSSLDECTWKDAWEKHFSKIRRYPDKMLIKIFGSATQIQLPTSKMDEISYKDILVYGDFLRQYHPRISQEIVLTGFIGTETVDIFKETSIDDETRSLIGLLVRSHGMNIRDTSTYLDERFAFPSKPKGIPIYYLMAILRIADYLDAGQGRAPLEIRLMNSQVSPISRMEWEWNQSIDFQDYFWDKQRETLTIHSNPKDTTQYNKVEKWLSDVQHEIDLCWAILGEYYGTEKEWLFSIRRINSNITDSKTRQYFEKRYLTKPATLSVNPDILKLLIGPLYNNNPSCGIRELIQNAVDACRERYVKETSLGNHDYKGNVILKIDTKNNFLIVSDNGIGMNSDILINYYLEAGASYRYSDNWASDFIVNEKSTIPRTGKFGIGVLTAFLLGKKIHLKTKHIYDELGLVFDLELNDSIINVTKSEKVNIGTEVKIQLTDEMLRKISRRCLYTKKTNNESTSCWGGVKDDIEDFTGFATQEGEMFNYICEWYFLESPSITYIVDDIIKENKIFVPDEHTNYANWFDFEVSDFASYKWSYEDPLESLSMINAHNPLVGLDFKEIGNSFPIRWNHTTAANYHLYCNGVIIPFTTYPRVEGQLNLPFPYISIIDNENKLNISLDRNTCELPYARELRVEQYKHFVAKLLLLSKEVLRTGRLDDYNIIYYQDSYTLESESLLKMAGIEKYFGVKDLLQTFERFNHGLSNYPIKNLELDFGRKIESIDQRLYIEKANYSLLMEGAQKIRCEDKMLEKLKSIESREKHEKSVLDLVCRSSELDEIFNLCSSPIVIEYETAAKFNHSTEKCLRRILSRPNDYSQNFYTEGRCDRDRIGVTLEDELALVLLELLGKDILIPIDRNKREEKFPRAFVALEKIMKQLDPEN